MVIVRGTGANRCNKTGKPLFEVKWEGYDKESDQTWEPEEHFKNALEVLNEYIESIGGRDNLRQDTATAPGRKRGRRASVTQQASGKRPKRNGSRPGVELDPEHSESSNSNPVCPSCKKPVYQEDLNEYKASHSTLTVSNMRRFCEQHTLRTARETWESERYPDIDWHRLEARITEHYDFLRKILDGAPSHYRDRFAEATRSGRNRTLLRSDINLTPGYYGIRGLNVMTEQLILELAAQLRERAVKDKLVSARGVAMFLQSVLVPELAVRLIMEDMDVGEEKARRILEESSAVGELLNDEVPDVVAPDSDDGLDASTGHERKSPAP